MPLWHVGPVGQPLHPFTLPRDTFHYGATDDDAETKEKHYRSWQPEEQQAATPYAPNPHRPQRQQRGDRHTRRGKAKVALAKNRWNRRRKFLPDLRLR